MFIKNMTLTANVFLKVKTTKISKKTYFKTPFDSQYLKGYQTLPKSAAKQFYQIFLIHLRDIEFKNTSLSHI